MNIKAIIFGIFAIIALICILPFVVNPSAANITGALEATITPWWIDIFPWLAKGGVMGAIIIIGIIFAMKMGFLPES